MRTVVTVLRAPTGAAAAAAATVDYVSGSRQVALTGPTAESVGGYFADRTPEGPGRWLGRGADRFGLSGVVARDDLESLLRGADPRTGATLGSSRAPTRPVPRHEPSESASWDQESFTFPEAASLLGISDRYLRQVAGRTRALVTRTGGDAVTLSTLHGDGRAFLLADQGDDGRWRVTRDELLRFGAARRSAAPVIGFDVTFSVPKSVSVLWAAADPPTRAEIMTAFDRAVDAGVDYLDRHCAVSGRGTDRVAGVGLNAAAFRHATSRRLDPQLHDHVVIANLIERPDGTHRALDGSALYEHAKTAAYLAGAQLRRELTERLGVSWRPVRSGIVEVAGVPQDALDAMSSRTKEIERLALQHGVTTPVGRRALALRSRTPKQVASFETLRVEWTDRLNAVGYDAAAHADTLGRLRDIEPVTAADTAAVFDRLLRHNGLTAHTATFTRGDVIQALTDWSIERLDAAGLQRAADALLADPRVLPLTPTVLGAVQHGQQRASQTPRFTTRAMVRAEARVIAAARRGARADMARVDPATIERAVNAASELGADQRGAVRALCSSGHRVRVLVGPAGSGKTHTLRVVAEAWRAGGYRVVGTAVQGTAAENLQEATGIPTRTLASLLAAVERDDTGSTLDARTVVVVDEASTVGTFDLARLVNGVEAAGASMVLVGDPAQHSAVSAGGGFAALTRQQRHLTTHLSTSRRQTGDAMTNVRLAVAELRTRDTDTALHRLLVDGRVHDASTRTETYDAIVRDWARDRATLAPTAPGAVCMVTEDHATRRELVSRARDHLEATGELTGPTLCVAGQEFRAGDEVIARAPAPDLHPTGDRDLHVRNGTCGRVLAVHQPDTPKSGIWVDFRSRGIIFVPAEALERDVRPGAVGVLTHSYALTSHAAQGATYETARAVATPTTSPAALYVAASRGRSDLRVYTAPTSDLQGDGSHDVTRDRETGVAALAASLRRHGDERLAIERDPSLLNRFDTSSAPRPELAPSNAVPATHIEAPAPDLEL